ncbi:MAG: acyl--CoA ligase [bacterium]|nr:acyl--CoA ligase [bacterium]
MNRDTSLAALVAAARRPPSPADAAPHDAVAALLARGAAAHPGRDWLVHIDGTGGREVLTYGEADARVASLADLLGALGVGRGDRVAVLAHNHPDTVLQYLAAWSLGACVVPLNAGEDAERLAFILAHSRAKLLFTRAEYLDRIEPLRSGLPLLRDVVLAGDRRRGYAHVDDAALAPAAAPAIPDADDEALIVYTSGTTGRPKGVVLTQGNLLVDGRQIAAWHGLGPGDRLMCVLPIHHVNGIVVTLVTPLVCGGAVVLCRKFRTEAFFPLLARERVRVVSVVPTLLAFLLQGADKGTAATGGLDLSGFRHLICGAGPLTCELALRFEARFGLRIVHGYGLSETTCYACFLPVDLPADEHRAWLGDHGFPSIGTPLSANEMAIHDPAGAALPAGERGEIVVRGATVMAGYFDAEAANRQAFAHGWFRSGDEGFWLPDRDGRPYFFITGRLKELIIRGGVNVSPLEVDEVLMSAPGVKAGVAVGFEHDVYGEEVGAYVVPLPGVAPDAGAVLDFCRRALPRHKCPKVVLFGDELPVTSTGKYRRNQLKPLFAAWRGADFRD